MTWTSAFTVVDTETTGVGDDARIVEIAVVHCEDGHVRPGMATLVNPEVPIPAEATAVHGIDDAAVARAPTFAKIAVALGMMLERRALCAYNEAFDRRLVGVEWARAGLAAVPWLQTPWLDPLVWVREAQKYSKGKKLVDVAARLNVPMPHALHRASADATLAAQIMMALRRPSAWADWKRRTNQDPRAFFPGELDECLRAQEAIRRRQEEEFAEWRAQQPERKGAA